MCVLLPRYVNAQGIANETIQRIKQEFSKAYFHWNRIRDQTWETGICQWDSIPQGAYYRSLEINPVYLDGFASLKFFEIEKKGNELVRDGHVLGIRCSHQDMSKDSLETFLIALSHLGEIKYISGDLILNDIYTYLDGPGKSLTVAKSRTYFLNMKEIKFLRKSRESDVFGGFSRILKTRVLISVVRGTTDQYSIWLKGKKRRPIQVVGRYRYR